MANQERAEHYYFRHALRAVITPQHHNSVSAETATKQMPRDKHTLSPGTPLLGLGPRSCGRVITRMRAIAPDVRMTRSLVARLFGVHAR